MKKTNLLRILGIVLFCASFAFAYTGDKHHYGMMGGMMMGSYGFGMGFFGLIIILLVIAVLVLLIIWLVKQIQKK